MMFRFGLMNCKEENDYWSFDQLDNLKLHTPKGSGGRGGEGVMRGSGG